MSKPMVRDAAELIDEVWREFFAPPLSELPKEAADNTIPATSAETAPMAGENTTPLAEEGDAGPPHHQGHT